MKEDALLRVGQKAFIEKDGKVLIVFDPVLGLDFPGGKIHEGETDIREALKREVREETSLEITIQEPFYAWYYEFPPESRNAGKKAYIVAFRCGYSSGEITLSNEHNKFQWVDKASYKSLDDGSEYFKALEKYFKAR